VKRHITSCALVAVLFLTMTGLASAANSNGSGGDMPAYYDDKLFTINFKELPPNAEQSVLANNKSINTIYMSDQAEAMGFDFISVLDAIQGEGPGFNPLWQEVQIVFVTIPPEQFTSDTDIDAAAAAGDILLVDTSEVYRCSVVGPGPKK
jgi:hypothetical protein